MEFKITEIVITDLQQLTGCKEILVVSVSEYKRYVDGQKTDLHGGYAYTAVLPQRKYASLIIRTEELQPSVTQEQLDASPLGGIYAAPVNLKAKIYKRGNDYALSCKAEKFAMKREDK